MSKREDISQLWYGGSVYKYCTQLSLKPFIPILSMSFGRFPEMYMCIFFLRFQRLKDYLVAILDIPQTDLFVSVQSAIRTPENPSLRKLNLGFT